MEIVIFAGCKLSVSSFFYDIPHRDCCEVHQRSLIPVNKLQTPFWKNFQSKHPWHPSFGQQCHVERLFGCKVLLKTPSMKKFK